MVMVLPPRDVPAPAARRTCRRGVYPAPLAASTTESGRRLRALIPLRAILHMTKLDIKKLEEAYGRP